MKDTNNNIFLSHIYNIYESYRFRDKFEVKTEYIKPPRGKGIKGLFRWLFGKKIKKITYVTLDDFIEKADEFIHTTLSKDSADFELIWDFCEFIRVCEKVFFFTNSPDQPVYSEMKFDNSNTRKLCIKRANYEIRFTLEHSILKADILSINVVRNYGLKMESTYRVVDGNIEYEDTSDLFLINEINRILMTCMRDEFVDTLQYILEGYYG